MPIRVLIADDHEAVGQGLRIKRHILATQVTTIRHGFNFLELDPELLVAGEAANGAEAMRMAHRLSPDVVLMDLLMPEMAGVSAIQLMRKDLPATEVIGLTSVLEDASVVGAVRAGAIGYLLRDTRADERLGIGERTIKTHVSRILAKLDVQSRTQPALYTGEYPARLRWRPRARPSIAAQGGWCWRFLRPQNATGCLKRF